MKNEKVYYIFGDSLMRSVMPERAGDYHANEYIGFPEMEKEYGITIKNYAMPTFTTERVLMWAKATMERELAAGNIPDAVIIECGGNDCDFDWKFFVESEGERYEHRCSLEKFSRDYRELISLFIEKGISVIVAAAPHIATEKYLDYIKNADENIKRLEEKLPKPDEMRALYLEYEKQMFLAAEEADCDVIWLQEYFEELDNPAKYFSADGMHPNVQGYELIGKSFRNYLVR